MSILCWEKRTGLLLSRSAVIPGLVAFVACLGFVTPSVYAQLTPGPDPITGTVNTAQTLASGIGTVSASGNLSIGGGTVAVTVTGNSTLNNFGTINQTGTGRALRLNTNGVTLAVNNGSNTNSTALIQAAGDDAFQVNQAADNVTLNNFGMINSLGGQAIDWAAITTGSNMLNNFSTGLITATGSDAVRPGVNGIISNSGTIRATPVQSGGNASGSDGIDAQTNSGVQVTNSGTIQGRAGITGGVTIPGTFAISVTNNNGGIISGVNGSGINIDGVATTVTANVTNNAGAIIKGTWDGVSANGDGDGIDVDGVLTLTNRGFIRALGANGVGGDGFANGPDGIAAGGGTIVNETGAEITAAVTTGNATFSQAILIDDSSRGNAIAATTVTNRGLIRSDNGAAIIIISTFANTITNDTGGTISGAGAVALGAAIQSGAGNDTVINRGIIAGLNGLALDLQGGNNSLSIEGGGAAITGDVNGGSGGTNSLTVSPGAGNTFSYSGVLSNFATAQINAGTAILSGNSIYTGTTTLANGGTLVARNSTAAGNSATGSGSVLVQNGGTLAGFGRIGGAVTVSPAGRLSPSDNGLFAPAPLNLSSNLNVTGGSRFTFALGPNSAGSDRVLIDGNLNFTSGSGPLIFDILNTGLTTGTYDLVDFAAAPGLTLGDLSFGNTPAGFSGVFILTSTSINVMVNAVPEPATFGFLGLGGLMLATSLYKRK